MKAGKPLRRTGGLRTFKALKSGGPLNPGRGLASQQQPLRRVPFRPQRPTVTPAERRARKLVRARAGEALLCEICGVHPGREWSHRLPRSAGGAWTASNGVWTCSDLSTPRGVQGCHQRAHANPNLAYRMGWFVHRGQDPAKTPAWLAGREFVLLGADGSVTPINDIEDSEAS